MPDLRTYRLQNQQIEYPQFVNPVDLLSHLGAIQGQDYPGAKWSLGLRLPGSTDAQIEDAIADNQIVRTWLMRGTLFLVPAADVRWMLEIVAPRVRGQVQRRHKELELDAKTLSRSNDILVNALAEGAQIGRRALYAILEEQGISTKGQRGVHLVQNASLNGLIIQGTVHKNDPVFMQLDRIPNTKTMSRDEALAELARRYFNSRSLASIQDFAWWTGLLMADVRAGFDAIRSELVEEVIDGKSYFYTGNPPLKPSPQSPAVYAPPGFDEYLLGYKDRDVVLAPEHATKVCPGKNGVFFPTIIVDGQIRGIWKRTFKKGIIHIVVYPFTTLNVEEKESFITEIQRFGTFLGMPVQVQFDDA